MPIVKQPRIHPVSPEIGTRGDVHIFLPEDACGPVPYVLGIHGGGWTQGSQEAFHFLWEKFQPLGVGLVLASYRVAPAHIFPAAYEDLLAVLDWLKSEGKSQGLEPSRCLLFGSSAGGHLAMLLATRAMAENNPHPDFCGVAQYCGVMDLPGQYEWDLGVERSLTRDFIGATPKENAAAYRAASPLDHVHSQMPPVWMAHGSEDQMVPFSQSLAMVKRLRSQNHDLVFLEARGLGHSMVELSVSGTPFMPVELLFEKDLLRFIQRCLLPT